MAEQLPLVLVSGSISELPPQDTYLGPLNSGVVTAGSGLVGGGDLKTGQKRLDAALATNPSGVIFVGDALGMDGYADVLSDTAQASGNVALSEAHRALASGIFAQDAANTALASGNAALEISTLIESNDIEYLCTARIKAGGVCILSNDAFPIPLKTFVVRVVADGGNKYAIDGVSQKDLVLSNEGVYRFDQSDSSNTNHPFYFSLTQNGTWAGGTEYTSNVNRVGVAGQPGAYVEITAPQNGPLYPYCGNHSGMGGSAVYAVKFDLAKVTNLQTSGGNYNGYGGYVGASLNEGEVGDIVSVSAPKTINYNHDALTPGRRYYLASNDTGGAHGFTTNPNQSGTYNPGSPTSPPTWYPVAVATSTSGLLLTDFI